MSARPHLSLRLRRFFALVSPCLLALASTPAPAAPTAPGSFELLRFDGTVRYVVDRGKARSQTAEPHAGPPGELRVEFKESTNKDWAVIALRPTTSLPLPVEGRALRLTLDPTASVGVIGGAIRLKDPSGETHQWRARFRSLSGVQTLEWTLEPGKSGHTAWGGDANRQLDGAIELADIALEVDAATGGRGLVRISSLRLQSLPGDSISALKADLLPAREVRYFTPLDRAEARLRLANPGATPVQTRIVAELRQPDGDWAPWVERDINLAPGQPLDLPLAHALERQGIWHWRVRSGRNALDSAVFTGSFAYFTPPDPSLPPPAGLDYATSGLETVSDARVARLIGARTNRTGVNWHELSSEEGKMDWTKLDKAMLITNEGGLRAQQVLGYGALWAAVGAPDSASWRIRMTYPPRPEAWRDYVRSVVERYRGQVYGYEIWNEPDLETFYRGNTAQYIELLRIASQEIRRGDPAAKVLSAGFATALEHGGRRRNPDIQARVLADAQDHFDVHVLHQHGLFDSFYEALNGPLAEMRRPLRSPRPLYFNETSVGTQFASEAEQAETLVKKFTYAASVGAVGYNWFLFRGRSAHTDHYGMVDMKTGEPRPVFVAYAALARELAGLTFERRIDAGEGRFALLFTGDERQVVVSWTEADAAGDAVLLAHGPGKPSDWTVRGSDLMGNTQPTDTTKSGVLIPVGRRPSYVEITGPSTPLRVALALDIRDEATVSNPSPEPLVYQPHQAEAQILYPGRSATFRPSSGHVLRLQLAGRSLELAAPERRTLRAGPRTLDGDPAFVLDRPAQVRNRFENDPRNEDKTWTGPADLSARAWIAIDGDQLTVRADVRDDLHHQPFTGWQLWNGDSLQIALADPSTPGGSAPWILGLARLPDGTAAFQEWARPTNMGGRAFNPRSSITPINGGLRYELTLSLNELGLREALARTGIGFNLLANDNDNYPELPLRKGWVQLAGGLATRRDHSNYPRLRLETP
jgi:hypothetical protein